MLCVKFNWGAQGIWGEGWNPEIFVQKQLPASALCRHTSFLLKPLQFFLASLLLCLCASACSLCLEWSLLDTVEPLYLPCGLHNTRESLGTPGFHLMLSKALIPAYFFVLKLLDGPWILHGLLQIPLCLLSSGSGLHFTPCPLISLSHLLSLQGLAQATDFCLGYSRWCYLLPLVSSCGTRYLSQFWHISCCYFYMSLTFLLGHELLDRNNVTVIFTSTILGT